MMELSSHAVIVFTCSSSSSRMLENTSNRLLQPETGRCNNAKLYYRCATLTGCARLKPKTLMVFSVSGVRKYVSTSEAACQASIGSCCFK